MKPLLLDSCALVYSFFQINTSHKLSAPIINQIADGNFKVLSVSFAELECLVQKNKFDLPINIIDTLLKELQELAPTCVINITPELWLKSIRLKWEENKDPADRLIVAYAWENNLSIVTSDQKIKAFYNKTTL